MVRIRHSSGGLRHVKALGLLVEGRVAHRLRDSGLAQDALGREIDVVNYRATEFAKKRAAGNAFKAPKRSNRSKWRKVAMLLKAGIVFWGDTSHNPWKPRKAIKTLSEAKRVVAELADSRLFRL